MEVKTTAFVLRATDYKENDKLLTLFSVDRGKITAALRGAKKPNAKLKFAAQPFLLTELVLAEKNGFYTVTQASAADAFYALRADVDKFYATSCMAQLLSAVLQDGQPEPALFSLLGESLKALCYEKTDARLMLLHFFVSVMKEQGVGADFSRCKNCGEECENAAISLKEGCVYCENCRPKAAIPLKEGVYLLLKAVAESSAADLCGKRGDPADERGALKLASDYFSEHLDVRLPALAQYLSL